MNFQTVLEIFEQKVKSKPNHIVLSDGDTSLTYQELDKKANQFANWLREQEVITGDVVALFLEPSIEFIICMLGVIKVGGVYLPLDTQAPLERVEEILSDAGAKVVVLDRSDIHVSSVKTYQLAEVLEIIRTYPKSSTPFKKGANQPLVIFYTAGSTGKPKGVLISHEAIVNLADIVKELDMNVEGAMAQFINPAFDPSSFEIWGALLNGTPLFIIGPQIRKDYIQLKRVLTENNVKRIVLPTAYFHQLASFAPDTLDALEELIFGGEQVNATVLINFLRYRKKANLPIKLINAYGPTEATTITCYHIITEAMLKETDQLCSIGKPIKNVQIYILDQDFKPVKNGEEGELYISGVNLALRYLNSPLLNEEKFFSNPFSTEEPYARLYKTGDLVKQSPTGELLYIGRVDDQVKVSGFRVHLNEIESWLLKYPNVGAAAVTVEKGGGAYTILKAYLVASSSEESLDADEIRAFLSKKLPPYMIPAKYVKIKAMPLTSVGKVDKKALTDAVSEDLVGVSPIYINSFVEKKLTNIWSNLLNRDVVDVNKNFFDLGANSLIITAACIEINKALTCSLQVADILTYPSIRKLGLYLEGYLEGVVSQAKKGQDVLDVAVVGMSCRFPEANSLAEFWESLSKGKDCLTRFASEAITDKNVIPVKGVIAGIDQFDAGFFGFSPADASILDPQQRIFLECAWEALEHSGNTPAKSNTKTFSVYAGMADSRYLQENLLKNKWFKQKYNWFSTRIATSMGTLATQVSYRFNLQGRSINVNTACSTGLVAIEQACQDLILGNSDVALVGAISIDAYQRTGYVYQQGGIESADGYCKPFAKDASGTIFSDGCGVVVLKRLSDAIKDNDTIYAVIKGCGINNDGAEKIGYAAPSTAGQMKCIVDALEQAQVSPEQIGFLESHGTATALGDVVEFTALTEAYSRYTIKTQYCALGSVKSNIGHTDIAAGMAGFIKAVLCLYNKQIPPMLHFAKPNPKIDFANSPFYVNKELLAWESRGGKRYAGVSSFGIGGTNAHIIVEEYRQDETHNSILENKIFILSAKNKTALEQNTEQLVSFLDKKESISPSQLADVAYTLQTGRDDLQWRRFALGKNCSEILLNLKESMIKPLDIEKRKGIVFMFSGQGSQYPNMARELFEKIPYFASIVTECCDIAKQHLGCDILPIIFDENDPRLYQTEFAQPILFIIEYALAKLLTYFGIVPEALIGYGIGEYIAACFAEVFSLEDAIAAISKRGALAANAPAGEIIFIDCTREEFFNLTKGLPIDLAAHNSQNHCTASGPVNRIAELEKRLQESGTTYQKTNFKRAFHSCSMEKVSQKFQEYLSTIPLSKPKIPMLSNITGSWFKASVAANPCYWGQHLRHTIEFYQGIETLAANGYECFIEIGPGRMLSDFVEDILPQEKLKYLGSVLPPGQNYKLNTEQQLLMMLGSLWQMGLKINWIAFYGDEKRKRVSLPTYFFNKQRYWLEPDLKDDLKERPVPALINTLRESLNISTEYVSPGKDIEKELIILWENILGIKPIGVQDDFFALGGDSLKALTLIRDISEKIKYNLTLQKIYETKTIANLAQTIESTLSNVC